MAENCKTISLVSSSFSLEAIELSIFYLKPPYLKWLIKQLTQTVVASIPVQIIEPIFNTYGTMVYMARLNFVLFLCELKQIIREVVSIRTIFQNLIGAGLY